MATLSRLEELRGEGRIIEVPMGGIQLVSFQQIQAIGTEGLGGCSVVIIASKHGAILAHIPPLPTLQVSPDPFGYETVRSMMGRVFALYSQYQAYFQPAETTIVCAWLGGQIGLADHLEIIRDYLKQLGHDPAVRRYDVDGGHGNPGRGTVVVTAGATRAIVYVEDNPM